MRKKVRILVTAGPTREMIDPVRFISNLSSGEMGYAVAKEAHRRGYPTTLLTGPTALPAPRSVKMVSFTTVHDLDQKLQQLFPKHDCLMMTAAVGDYRVSQVARRKIKRKDRLTLTLVRTPDLLKKIGKKKKKKIIVGFCLETENLMAHAFKKLQNKQCDFMVACFLNKSKNPFGQNMLSVTVIDKKGKKFKTKSSSKTQIAKILLHFLERKF